MTELLIYIDHDMERCGVCKYKENNKLYNILSYSGLQDKNALCSLFRVNLKMDGYLNFLGESLRCDECLEAEKRAGLSAGDEVTADEGLDFTAFINKEAV